MKRTGPIVIVEDDPDDQLIMEGIFHDLGVKNKLYFFSNPPDVLEYLSSTSEDPLIIISDVNMPGMDGIELRHSINQSDYLRKKSIPFIFYTTSAKRESVDLAYDMMVQGYFQKPNSIEEARSTLKMILDYWNVCLHPNCYTTPKL
ncbi:MAG TPA: response regulator [Chitinophagaceae bacterium]